jgi:O-antigen/teichoic acid export membrane protein
VPVQIDIKIGETAGPKTGWAAWAGRGVVAALEQGSVSGSNFVLSVALARWVTPAEYGQYAVAFSMLLLGAACYQAVFLTPLMVNAPRLGRAQKAAYLWALLRMHGWGAAILGAAAGGVCIAGTSLGWPLPVELALASTFTTVALTLQWLLRDCHYQTLSPAAAARGSILYGLVMMAGLLLIGFAGAASAWEAVALMGLAALASAASQFHDLEQYLLDPDPSYGAADVWRSSRPLARWEIWISLASWAPVHLTFPVTAGLLGPGATGALRALQNFAMPLNQIVVALSRLVLPYLCGRPGEGESPIVQGRRIAWAALGVGLGYTAVLWLVARPVVRVLYGGAYGGHAWLMPLAILPMAFWGGAQALGLALRAAGRFPVVLAGSIATGVLFAVTVVPATRAFGVAGALGAASAAQFLGLVLLALVSSVSEEPAGSFRAMPLDGGGA